MPENIFLDTSIFVQENFLDGKRIQQFLKLSANGSIQLILSVITVNEIKAQFKKRARVALEMHGGVINDKHIWVLRNSKKERNKLEKFSNLKTICTEFDLLLDKKLRIAKAIILDYPTINVKPIFEKYFNGIYPFNTGEKKHEFPDAIALLSLEEWCLKNKQSCIIFSKDKDFLRAKPAEGITVDADFEKYLEMLLTRLNEDRVGLVKTLFVTNDTLMDAELKDWIKDELDNNSIYYDFTNSFDVHDIEIPLINVERKRFQILSVDEETIDIEVIANVKIQIVLTIDDEESGIYDSEEKEMHYVDTCVITLDQELEIPMSIRFYILHKDEFDDKCEIVEINNGQPIELEHDMTDYF